MEKSNISNSISNNNIKKIFVGGLPKDATKQELAQIFDKYGIVKSIKLPKHQKKNRIKGYAIIEFNDSNSVQLAINHLNGSQIRGKMIAVKVALDSDQASKATKEMQKRKLFVKNLPENCKEKEIWDFFKEFGKVEKVQMAYSNETQTFKGIAYITMNQLQEVENILRFDKLIFKGQVLGVEQSKAIGKVYEERHKNNNRPNERKSPNKKSSKSSKKSKNQMKTNQLMRGFSGTTNQNTNSRRGSFNTYRRSQRHQDGLEARQFYPASTRRQYPSNFSNIASTQFGDLTGQALIDRHNLLFRGSQNSYSRLTSPSSEMPQNPALRSQFLDSVRGVNNSNYRFNVLPIYNNEGDENGNCEGIEGESGLVVRQVVKTEYRIKDTRGVVYLGEINETNIWSSGRNSERSGGSEEGEESGSNQ